jgi:hypothetical protein
VNNTSRFFYTFVSFLGFTFAAFETLDHFLFGVVHTGENFIIATITALVAATAIHLYDSEENRDVR